MDESKTILVISPYLSQIKEQVEASTKFGLVVQFFNGETDFDTRNEIEENLKDGQECQLFFISPQMLRSRNYLQNIFQAGKFSRVVFDDARFVLDSGKCSTFNFAKFRLDNGDIPFIALTSAFGESAGKILQILKMEENPTIV